ncbi:MAG: hypothetical protein ACAH17_02120, partial [Candidatus Paceibacterota bacterium]
MAAFHHICTHGLYDDAPHEIDIKAEKTDIVDAFDVLTTMPENAVVGVYVLIHSAADLCKSYFGEVHPHYVRVSLFTGLH